MTDKTLSNFKEDFSDWDTYYKKNKVEEMPWYEIHLDHDLENEIKLRNLSKGKFLDLGTGPGTQATQLAKLNFDVTATDISLTAINNAKKLSNKVNFLVDDVLNSQLSDNEFDFILDRGIFHVFDVSQRPQYVKQITRILGENGILFLKCMSVDEKNIPDNDMPHKLSKQELIDVFSNDFDIESMDNSVFHGALDIKLKALFTILKKKSIVVS
jgi:ubiquinone/menaquinone biosynthesis C-methylase UbiE